jgi:hypothetical protein
MRTSLEELDTILKAITLILGLYLRAKALLATDGQSPADNLTNLSLKRVYLCISESLFVIELGIKSTT